MFIFTISGLDLSHTTLSAFSALKIPYSSVRTNICGTDIPFYMSIRNQGPEILF